MSVQLFDNLSRILYNLSILQSFCLSVGLLICQAVSQLLYWMVCLFICLSAFLMHVCPSTGICFDFVMVYSCLLCFIDSTIQLWLISNNILLRHILKNLCCSSVHYCKDHHIHLFICSSHIWFSYIHSHQSFKTIFSWMRTTDSARLYSISWNEINCLAQK